MFASTAQPNNDRHSPWTDFRFLFFQIWGILLQRYSDAQIQANDSPTNDSEDSNDDDDDEDDFFIVSDRISVISKTIKGRTEVPGT